MKRLYLLLSTLAAIFFSTSFNTANGQTRTITFSTAGSFSWQAPCGVTNATVYVWGAGGGGAGANNGNAYGGGGGGGAFVWHNALPLTPGTNYTITVGAAGVGNTGNGSAGGNSSFGTVIVAGAGQGGTRNGGAGGVRGFPITIPGGGLGYVGGTGADGIAAYGGGGGGSSASPPFNNGNNATGSAGAIAPAGGGDGGNGNTTNGPGTNGTSPGGGGGGAKRTSGTQTGGNGGAGKVVIIYQGPPSPYCVPEFTAAVEPITSVTFAGITNTSSPTVISTNPNQFSLQSFCSPQGNVTIGQTYPITVKGNTAGNFTDFFRVFIDWNQNNSFGDPGETFSIGSISNSTGTDAKFATVNIGIPSGALLGKTLMRVMKRYNGDPTNSCSLTYSNGEAEDYVINVFGSCQQPTGATANGVANAITVCSGTLVTLRQTGGTLSADQQWVWSKASCTGADENINTYSDAAYSFTPMGAGSTDFYVKARGGSCGTPGGGPCQKITLNVIALGTIAVSSGYTASFSACRNVNNPDFTRFSIGGAATGATVTGLPAGMTGTYSAGTFIISGTPTAPVGTYNYTINLSGNAPCVNPTAGGVVTITDKPTVSYTGGPFTYCIGGAISPNTPVVTTGGLSTGFAISPLSAYPSLPAGLSLNSATGEITGTPTGPATGALIYTIRASNGCGFTDVNIDITISAGNTVFSMTPTGTQTICSSSAGVAIGLNSSLAGISYQLYRGATAVGSAVAGNNGPIGFGLQTVAGSYRVVAITNCATNMNGVFDLVVTPQPNASFTYPSYTFCKTGTSAAATISGIPVTGGVFSSSAGLVFSDASTGAIDLVASNPGLYTISYSGPASGGCAAYSNINPTPVQIVSSPNTYTVTGGGAYCSGGAGRTVWINNSQLGVQYQLYNEGIAVGSPVAGTGGVLSFGNQTLPGEYTVKAVLGGCSKLMDQSVIITINPVPADITVNPATATLCSGTVMALTATLAPPSVTTNSITISSGAISQGIPDNNAAGTFYVLRMAGIPAGATITAVSVNYNIAHLATGDLLINLKGPNGNVLNIANGIGGTGDNYTNTTVNNSSTTAINTSSPPFTGTFAPQAAGAVQGASSVSANFSNAGSFSNLYGATSASANGNWIFSARDKSAGTTGTLSNCSITISYSLVNNPTTVNWSPATDLFTDPAGSIPYTAGSNASTIYVKPATAGSVTYTATSSNGFGCSKSASTTLTVNASPQITMVANYCIAPGKVRITATSNVAISSWLWNTGGTGTIAGLTSYIDVDVAGNYFVSARSSGNTCLGTGMMNIAQELLGNGAFTLGNTGFSSDYFYQPDVAGNNELVNDLANGGTNGYGIGTDARNYHPGFWGIDHTSGTGDGNFMIVNGHGSLVVWKNQNVTVLPNTTYYFSAWGMSLNNVGPFAQLSFRINNVNVGTSPVFPAGVNSNANNGWTRFYGTWTSGPTTTLADISIVNLETSLPGNDFALDDISFATLSSFFTVNPSSGSLTQTNVCAGTPIDDIFFEVGGDGNPPTLTSGTLPPGLTTYWNGRTFRISGRPTTAGTYNFQYSTTGCSPKTQNISISSITASDAGSITGAPIISACYGSAGSIPVTGTVGTLAWETSVNGVNSWLPAPDGNFSNLQAGVYYRVIAQNTAACGRDTSAVVKLGVKNLWTGQTNDSWNLASNWSDESLPSLSPCDNLVIPDVSPKPFPIVSGGTVAVKNLEIKTGANLLLLNNASLQVAGAITSPPSAINANDAVIEMNGTTQTISGSWFAGRNLEQLKVSGTVLNAGTAANDTLNILSLLSFGNPAAQLNMAQGMIAIKSSALRTARVDMIPAANSISYGTGKFIVERYIRSGRKWRFLSLPTDNTSQTFKTAWQEGAAVVSSNPNPGYGTIIGDNHSGTYAANGFDSYTPGGPTVKYLNAAGTGYTGIGSTNTPVQSMGLGSSPAFFSFIQGDRSVTTVGPTSSTTLRSSGKLFVNPGPVSVTGSQIKAIGNPLASPVDMIALLNPVSGTGLVKAYQVWDPQATLSYGFGNFQAMVWSGTNFEVFPGGGSYGAPFSIHNSIESGLGFFVKGDGTTGANISFTENVKGTSATAVSFTSGMPQRFRGMLNLLPAGSNPVLLDGFMLNYDDGVYSDAIDADDIPKMLNTGENAGISSQDALLIIERRSAIRDNDTVHVKLSNLRIQHYQWEIISDNLDYPGRTGFLIDRYTNTTSPLNMTGTTTVNFDVENVAASYAANRFIIVFRQPEGGPLPVTITAVSATRREDKTIAVQWKVENEINMSYYEVERSADGNSFTGIHNRTVQANNGGRATYDHIDLVPGGGDNFYRIKANSIGGQVQYSAIVKVAAIRQKPSISVYPNPIEGRDLQLRFVGQPAGKYVVQVSNVAGQVIYRSLVSVSSVIQSSTISLPAKAAAGFYQLRVVASDGSATVEQLMLK